MNTVLVNLDGRQINVVIEGGGLGPASSVAVAEAVAAAAAAEASAAEAEAAAIEAAGVISTAALKANNLSDLVSASSALTNLGGTTVGKAVFTAVDAAAARTATGLVIGTDVQAYAANLTTWAGVTPGTGVAAALAVNVGSAGAPVLFNGAGGTPSSLTLTNATGLPVAGGGTGAATAADARTNLAVVGTAALAAVSGASLVGFEAGMTGDADRTVQAKLRDFVNAADFGFATTNTAAQNTTALQAAMTALMARFPDDLNYYAGGPGDPTGFQDVDRQTGTIYIPAGRYYVSPNVFSSLTNARAAYVGFDFQGEGKMSTVLMLVTGAASTYFYNNGAGSPNQYQQMHWKDIGFRSDNYLYGNGFKVYSEGGPKQFRWTDCDFQYLRNFLYTEGTGNADLTKVTRCTGIFYGDLLTLDNDQSVQHDFIGCDFGTYGNFVRVMQYGGGNVSFINGSYDAIWHATYSPAAGRFLYTEDSNSAVGQGNCTFVWRDCRIEVEGYTTKATVRAATDAAGYAAGVSTVTLASSGTGAIAIGDTVHFGGDPTVYTVTSGDADVSNGGSISFTPALIYAIDAETTVISTNNPLVGLVKTQDTPNAGVPRIIFDNVNFVNGATYTIDGGGAILSQNYRRIYAATVHPNKHVHFKNCQLLKTFWYAVGSSGSRDGPAYGGILKFSDCGDGITTELPSGDSALSLLHSRGRYLGSAGRIITEGMVEHTTGASSTRFLVDADPGWPSSIAREPATPVKRLALKHYLNGLPRGANADSDSYIDLPVLQGQTSPTGNGSNRKGITNVRIVVRKPASGAVTDTYQMHVKTTDRSGTILGSSTSAQFKDLHTIELNDVDLTNITRICLCASGTWNDYAQGGVAYIEYA